MMVKTVEMLLKYHEIFFVHGALFRLIVEKVWVHVKQERSVHYLPLLRRHARYAGAYCLRLLCNNTSTSASSRW